MAPARDGADNAVSPHMDGTQECGDSATKMGNFQLRRWTLDLISLCGYPTALKELSWIGWWVIKVYSWEQGFDNTKHVLSQSQATLNWQSKELSRTVFSRELGSFAFQKFSLATDFGAVVLLFWTFGSCSLVPAQLSGKWNLFVPWAAGSATRPVAQNDCASHPLKMGLLLPLGIDHWHDLQHPQIFGPFPWTSQDLWNCSQLNDGHSLDHNVCHGLLLKNQCKHRGKSSTDCKVYSAS